jgi:hypothetical protein
MREPLDRLTFDAPVLLREHPPQFRHPSKAALFDIAYPDRVAAPARIEVTRWAQFVPDSLSFASPLMTQVRPDFYDYRPVAAAASAIEWHVNFADPRLFVAYGSALFAQDEMQVAEHPLLGSVRESLLANGCNPRTSDETGATPYLVRNVERRIMVSTEPNAAAGRPLGLYGNRFAAAPFDVIRQATQRIDPPTFSNIIAMAAPSGGYGDYTAREIASIFATAYTAFAAAVQESQVTAEGAAVLHTGFWGCGAFGGNRRLMVALQTLAAQAAGVQQLVLHAGDPARAKDATRGLEVAEAIALRCGSPCPPAKLIDRCVLLGYQWGVSDGN